MMPILQQLQGQEADVLFHSDMLKYRSCKVPVRSQKVPKKHQRSWIASKRAARTVHLHLKERRWWKRLSRQWPGRMGRAKRLRKRQWWLKLRLGCRLPVMIWWKPVVSVNFKRKLESHLKISMTTLILKRWPTQDQQEQIWHQLKSAKEPTKAPNTTKDYKNRRLQTSSTPI